jgi:broad specificity phosphatase PhoE
MLCAAVVVMLSGSVHGQGDRLPPTKAVLMVRHGQGWHNLLEDKSNTETDAGLTPLGYQQAAATRARLAAAGDLDRVELVVSSPLRRAVETTLAIFCGRPGVPDPPVVLQPLVAERYDDPCDGGMNKVPRTAPHAANVAVIATVYHTGLLAPMCGAKRRGGVAKSALAALHPAVAGWGGWAALPEEWSEHRVDHAAFEARGPAFRAWLAARPEATVAVVGHGLQQLRDVGVRPGLGRIVASEIRK